MLAIRLQRIGRKKQPLYRVVVSESTKDMYGDHLENLGTYNPKTKETKLNIEQIKHWLDKGAQPSNTIYNFLVKEGVLSGDKKRSVRISDKRKAKKEAPKEDKPEEGGETKPAEEAPVEENKEAEPAKEEVKPDEPKEEVKEEKKEEAPKEDKPTK